MEPAYSHPSPSLRAGIFAQRSSFRLLSRFVERSEEVVKIAFVGLGGAARDLHLPAARSVADVEIVGGVDPSAEARAAWLRLGASRAYSTFDELLEVARPELVVVATPPDTHALHTRRALEAGAHVLCEKPFVEKLEQADEILAVAERCGRQVMVNHQYRFMPIFAGVNPLLGTPGIGRPLLVQATQLMYLPPWSEPVAWRAAMSHRTLFEGGVHIVDLVHWYFGRLPERVSASTSSGFDRSHDADAIHLVTLDYGDGALAQICINRLSRTGTRYIDLRVDCEDASIRASYGGRAFVRVGMKRAERAGLRLDFGLEGLSWIERGTRRKVIARNGRGSTAGATGQLYRATIEALRTGRTPPTVATAARDTLRIIEAAYDSAARGVVVPLGDGSASTVA
jgi:predicted dehydrogenase